MTKSHLATLVGEMLGLLSFPRAIEERMGRVKVQVVGSKAFQPFTIFHNLVFCIFTPVFVQTVAAQTRISFACTCAHNPLDSDGHKCCQ